MDLILTNEQLAFKKRLSKNIKKYLPFFKNQKVDCFRLYERDLPDFPYLIDFYRDEEGEVIVLSEKGQRGDFEEKLKVVQEIIYVLLPSLKSIFLKKREKQSREFRYQALEQKNEWRKVREGDFYFLVNYEDYLDTGLFLDFRLYRKFLHSFIQTPRVLNLFCYTGSLSIAAAKGKEGRVKVTSVDRSKKYLEVAEKNFLLNDLSPQHHCFVQDSVKDFLIKAKGQETFDVIIFDPPTSSKSKKSSLNFDLEEDYLAYLSLMRDLLPSSGGLIFFSCNKRGFSPKWGNLPKKVENLTEKMRPLNHRDSKLNQIYQLYF